MATLKTTFASSWAPTHSTTSSVSWLAKFNHFADSQAQNRTLWFFVNLVVHGVFILPLPVVLIYYFNAPVVIILATMTCFFMNIIANMGGAGIRTTIGLFAISLLVHVGMVLVALI